jgi:hypothetical protein
MQQHALVATLMPKAADTSSGGKPSTSRIVITTRCASGSASITSQITVRVSPSISSAPGVCHSLGPIIQPPA